MMYAAQDRYAPVAEGQIVGTSRILAWRTCWICQLNRVELSDNVLALRSSRMMG